MAKYGPFPLGSTIGDLYKPAMEIHDESDAREYGMRHGQTREEAEGIQRQNLGYFAGYYDSETRERVERLFSCTHPVFGSIAQNGEPTFQEAFDKGREAAQ